MTTLLQATDSSSAETYERPRGPEDAKDKSEHQPSKSVRAGGAEATPAPAEATPAPEVAKDIKEEDGASRLSAKAKKPKSRRDLQCWICHRWIADNPCSRDQHERSLYCMTKRYMWQGYSEGAASQMAEAYVASLWDRGAQRHQWSERPKEPPGLPPQESLPATGSKEETRSRPRLRSRERRGYYEHVPEEEKRRRRRRSGADSRRGHSQEHRHSRGHERRRHSRGSGRSERRSRTRTRGTSSHRHCGDTRRVERGEPRRQMEAAEGSKRARGSAKASEPLPPKQGSGAVASTASPGKPAAKKKPEDKKESTQVDKKAAKMEAEEKEEQEEEEEESSSSSSSSESKDASADAEAGVPAAAKKVAATLENQKTRQAPAAKPKVAAAPAKPARTVAAEAPTAAASTAPKQTTHAAALEMANSLLATAMREAKRLM